MSAPVIEARGLVKRYGTVAAVDGIDLTVNAGEVVGLLGPNGAGKTTTILMLLGLTEASAGSVRILGKDPLRQPLEVKRQVGYLPDAVGFYESMTGRENLRYVARLAGTPAEAADARIEGALERVRLADVGDRRVGTYSRGMRQRLGLAEVLMRECRVAILDEPTSGLDPQSTRELLQLIQRLSTEGMTILLSSHMLDVVQSVCHRVALFGKGRLGFIGTVEELAQRVVGGAFVVEIDAEGIDLGAALEGMAGVAAVERHDDGLWRIETTSDLRPELARRVVERGGALRSLDAHRAPLGEIYARYFAEARHEA